MGIRNTDRIRIVNSSNQQIIVIGGGAAGMIAAWRAALLGARVLLLEKNPRLGIKLLISGGGKCNITHSGTTEKLLQHFQINESRFLKHALYSFTNTDVIELLHTFGVETEERVNGKIFPASEKAGDVVHAFRRAMEKAGVAIQLSSTVQNILRDEQGVCGVCVQNEIIPSRHIILAAGGISYKKTGTTGDGFTWAEHLGHTIVPLRPALAPIILSPIPPREFQGVAIRDCTLQAIAKNKIIAEWHGDVLFTHFGISGPAALEVSKDTFIEFEKGNIVSVHVDFFSEYSVQEVEKMIHDEIQTHGTRVILTLLEQMIPQRLAPFFLSRLNIDAATKLHQLKKNERILIAQTLKQWNIGSVQHIDIDRGEVTAGGIALHEVDATTMRSKIVNGLYCCGEVLDIAGPVGGFNLQAAFSSGFVAGESAGKEFLQKNQQPVTSTSF